MAEWAAATNSSRTTTTDEHDLPLAAAGGYKALRRTADQTIDRRLERLRYRSIRDIDSLREAFHQRFQRRENLFLLRFSGRS